MLPPLLADLAEFALSVSAQVVVVAVLSVGLTLMTALSEPALVLALLIGYLATAVLLAALTAPELAFVVVLVGIFVALMMHLTARERRQSLVASGRSAIPRRLRILTALIVLWLAWSLNLFEQPLDAQRLTTMWLATSAGTALATSTDPFKVGIALLMLVDCSLLHYATSTAEVSLLVFGVVALSSFVISLAASHLALSPATEAQE